MTTTTTSKPALTRNQKFLIGQMQKQVKRRYINEQMLDQIEGVRLYLDDGGEVIHEVELVDGKIQEFKFLPSNDGTGMNSWQMTDEDVNAG